MAEVPIPEGWIEGESIGWAQPEGGLGDRGIPRYIALGWSELRGASVDEVPFVPWRSGRSSDEETSVTEVCTEVLVAT